ncbi:hypothetical protein BDZ91DRAFT_712849 [Kalaharituber pfeilii]|nr:hypothetical protein BDZ91DRAFT_712849 [Kalaharituber pfeilii]
MKNRSILFPRLCCWLADHMENASLHGLYNNVCPISTVRTRALGDGDKHLDCRSLYKFRHHKSIFRWVKFVDNALWTLPLAPPDLVRRIYFTAFA